MIEFSTHLKAWKTQSTVVNKPLTGITTYYKEIQRKPARFSMIKPIVIHPNKSRFEMRSNEVVQRREPLMKIHEEKRQRLKRKIMRDYDKILNYSERVRMVV